MSLRLVSRLAGLMAWLDTPHSQLLRAGAQNTAIYWVHGNNLGVPIVTTDSSGNAANPTGYTALGFPGQTKTLSDIYYNRYRDYDSSTGRYIQADPIGLRGGSNPYLYALGNPLKYSDPRGLCLEDLCIGEALVIGSAAMLIDYALQKWLHPQCINYGELFGTFVSGTTIPIAIAASAGGGAGFELGAAELGASDAGAAAGDAGVGGAARGGGGAPIGGSMGGGVGGATGGGGAAGAEIGMAGGGPNILPASGNLGAGAGDYTYTVTVLNNQLSRPWIGSRLFPQVIENTGLGVPDPGGIPTALRYEVLGSYSGPSGGLSYGTWELVVDPETKMIYHFNFISH